MPTHAGQISLTPSRNGQLIEKLDVGLVGSGLSRRGGVKGLPELKKSRGRDIASYVYELETSKQKFMVLKQDITELDVINGGTVEIEVYSAVLADDSVKKDAMSRLQKILAEYGATLKERPTETKPK